MKFGAKVEYLLNVLRFRPAFVAGNDLLQIRVGCVVVVEVTHFLTVTFASSDIIAPVMLPSQFSRNQSIHHCTWAIYSGLPLSSSTNFFVFGSRLLKPGKSL